MPKPMPMQAPEPTLAGIAAWAAGAALGPTEVDCTTTVMLKILDGKCKMATQEKAVIALLYDALRGLPAPARHAACACRPGWSLF